MAITIENNGVSLKITDSGVIRYVIKSQIKEVSIVRDTIIKIDIGQGALNNFYLDQTAVTTPSSVSADDLRDKIIAMLQTSAAGIATEANQNTEITLLQNLQTALADLNNKMSTSLDNNPPAPIIVDESNASVVYYGFAVPGAKTTDPVWAIQRVTKLLGITTYQWAGGNKTYTKIWNNRLVLTYS